MPVNSIRERRLYARVRFITRSVGTLFCDRIKAGICWPRT